MSKPVIENDVRYSESNDILTFPYLYLRQSYHLGYQIETDVSRVCRGDWARKTVN